MSDLTAAVLIGRYRDQVRQDVFQRSHASHYALIEDVLDTLVETVGSDPVQAKIKALEDYIARQDAKLAASQQEAEGYRMAANREAARRHDAYAKLDVLTAEYRRLALALADVIGVGLGPVSSMTEGRARTDAIQAVTDAFLASLERVTARTNRRPNGEGPD